MRAITLLRKRQLSCLLALLSVCFCPALMGQGLTGQVSGTLTDPSGAPVNNADLVITNSQTNQSRSTKSDADGHFVFTELLPGVFKLTADAPGFKKFEQTQIVVTATERVTLPGIALQVGTLNETVSVSGENRGGADGKR